MLKEGYEYTVDDFYCYPGTAVLKNKLNITNPAELEEAERKITSLRYAQALQTGIAGSFDFNHLKKIHSFLFGDLYEWAGKTRVVNISKENMFCAAIYIADQAEEVFTLLAKEHFLKNCITKRQTAERLAYYLSEINAIHPFREGNGRSQRLFITFLAASIGWELDFGGVSPQEMLGASVESFGANYEPMENLIFSCMKIANP